MKTKLFATAAAVLSLTLSPLAYAQQTTGDVAGDAALSNSQAGATSQQQQSLVNGGSSANNGGVFAPTNAESTSGANSTANLANQNTVGPINASHGDTITGPSTADSTSSANSGSISGSSSTSEGGAVGDTISTSQATGGQGGAGGSGSANSSATGGNSTSSTGASTSTSTANPNANNDGNSQNITFNSSTPKHQSVKTNPAVYAPAMTTTLTETCMGSTSGGLSVLGFGGTLGTTWNDEQCVRRLNAREMAQTLGDRDAARALLCQDKHVAEAYASVGQDCRAKTVIAVVEQRQLPPQAADAGVPPPQPQLPPTATMKPIPDNYVAAGERGH